VRLNNWTLFLDTICRMSEILRYPYCVLGDKFRPLIVIHLRQLRPQPEPPVIDSKGAAGERHESLKSRSQGQDAEG
jgi:hypothetical protein